MALDILQKPSALIRLEHRLTLVQQQVWNVMLATSMNGLSLEREHRIAINILSDFVTAASNRVHFESAIRQLETISLGSEVFEDQHAYPAYPLLHSLRISSGVTLFRLSKDIIRIMDAETIFCDIDLTLQTKYKGGKYGWFLYELCKNEIRRSQTKTVSLSGFRRYLGIPEHQYSSFKDLNKRVIQPAIADINSQTDLTIEINFKRKDRRINELTLSFKPVIPIIIDIPPSVRNEKTDRDSSLKSTLHERKADYSKTRLLDSIVKELTMKSESYQQLTPYYQAKLKREIFYNYISTETKQPTLLTDARELSDNYLKTQWTEFQSYLVDKNREEKQIASSSQTEILIDEDLSGHRELWSDTTLKSVRDNAPKRISNKKGQREQDIRAIGLVSRQSEKRLEEEKVRRKAEAEETMRETHQTEIEELKSLLS